MDYLLLTSNETLINKLLERREYYTILVKGYKIYQYDENKNKFYLSLHENNAYEMAMVSSVFIMNLKPNYIISLDLSDTYNQSVNEYDFVASSSVVNDELSKNIKASRKMLDMFPFKKGIITSISHNGDLEKSKKNYPNALAYDYTSCALGYVCKNLERSFISIRCILKEENHEADACKKLVSEFDKYMNREKENEK